MQIKDYIDSNKDRFLDELYDLLRIESVSADPKFKDSVDRAADYLVDQFNKLNLDVVGFLFGFASIDALLIMALTNIFFLFKFFFNFFIFFYSLYQYYIFQ